MSNRHNHSAGGEKPASAWHTTKRLLGYLRGSYGRIIIALLANAAVTLLVIGALRLNGYAVDHFIMVGDMEGLKKLCFVLIAIFILSSLLTYVEMIIMAVLSQNVSATLRSQLNGAIVALPLTYHDQHTSGDLMSRLTNDVDNVNQTLSQGLTSLLEGIVNVGGMLVAMFFLSPFLTMWAMVIVPLTAILTRVVVHFSRRFFKSLQADLGEMNGYIEEMISGQKATILFDRSDHVAHKFAQINARLTRSYSRAQTLSAMGPMMNFISNLVYLAVTIVGVWLILEQNAITVGVLFTFLLYMRRFARPLNTIAELFNTIQAALAGAERIFEIMDTPPEGDLSAAKPLVYKGGRVIARDLVFSYDGKEQILDHISFTAEPGETIAIVGPTGSGKTTIISLLNRFYELDGGQITIDGQDIATIQQDSLRQTIGMVLQDTFLFTDTIKENILYGRPDASDEEVIQAATLAGADGFICQLENGYDTIIGDNGDNFSHGQRQLLAIARAILANAKILVLDEATSSIDTRTEQLVQASLKQLMANHTTFVIAHRLSTITGANQILVLEKGRIVERGTHQSLLAADGLYAKMYFSQLGAT